MGWVCEGLRVGGCGALLLCVYGYDADCVERLRLLLRLGREQSPCVPLLLPGFSQWLRFVCCVCVCVCVCVQCVFALTSVPLSRILSTCERVCVCVCVALTSRVV